MLFRSSGFPSLDLILDYIRLGDNVVLQISKLEEFTYFTKAFVKQAKREERNLIYIRFATHEALVEKEDAKWFYLDPGIGFEQFTIQVHRIIEKEGKDSFYLFDCLSELQVAWAADLMMGNSFCVTCPFLFQLDTVAVFPILRGDHAFDSIARIRETTQLFLDIYSDKDHIYIHPIKVWNRYSASMFLPHRAKKEEEIFHPVKDSVSMTKYYALVANATGNQDQQLDSWERYFQESERQEEREDICSNLCRMLMTKDAQIRTMFSKFFTQSDYLAIKKRMIGSGKIGGKSCGMLLARSIIEKCMPDRIDKLEPHDSYYIGDHVFYTYLVFNHLWDLHISQKQEDGYYKLAEALSRGILEGQFPENIRSELRRMLDYYGQSPIIVRSSSMLEDGFGNAFAGKYESVFCANQGTMEERLVKLEAAIRTVYASTVNPSALEYRQNRGLDELEEQMSVLVQRVSGSIWGEYFFPSAAGVGYSHDTYAQKRDTDVKKGMLRMVFGLGTRAVDRTDNDYPRIIHIDNPNHSYHVTQDEKVKFSQRKLDVIQLKENRETEISLEQMIEVTPKWYQNYVLEHDFDLERSFRERGIIREICYGTCHGFTKNEAFLRDRSEERRVGKEC